MRATKDQYYLEIAKAVASRSTCLRRQYGAVIVKDDEIVSTGYNGAPRIYPNCSDLKTCERERLKVPHGEQYEKCVAVHAEQNAIISASRKEMLEGRIYLAGFENGVELINPMPCLICSRMIANAGIKYVINNTAKIGVMDLWK